MAEEEEVVKLRPVLQGEEYVCKARGSFGVVRALAETDGFAWETEEECGFVPMKLLEHVLSQLRRKQREAKPR